MAGQLMEVNGKIFYEPDAIVHHEESATLAKVASKTKYGYMKSSYYDYKKISVKGENMFKNKTLVITGGTGSFGNAVLKRFLDTDITEIRIFSRDEKKQDDMRKKNIITQN